MKISLSTSFFNCPPVADILHSCDVVYTSNSYALANFAHKDIRSTKTLEHRNFPKSVEVVTLEDIQQVFYKWVVEEASDLELLHYTSYFNTAIVEKIREIAKGSLLLR